MAAQHRRQRRLISGRLRDCNEDTLAGRRSAAVTAARWRSVTIASSARPLGVGPARQSGSMETAAHVHQATYEMTIKSFLKVHSCTS